MLRFRGVEQEHRARARRRRAPAGSTRRSRPTRAAIASSPDSAFLYRELAAVERQQGERRRRARALPQGGRRSTRPTRRSLAQIGEILEARGDLEGAAKAYTDVAGARAERRRSRRGSRRCARASALARLPAEYRAIDQAPQITRARSGRAHRRPARAAAAGRPRGATPALITDVRNNWAATWIMAVARAGVMEPFANHTFQPRTVVRRSRSRAGRRPAAERASPRSARTQAEAVGHGAAEVHRSAAEPPRLSGRVGGGRVRRDDDRGRATPFSRRGRSPAPRRSTPSRKLEALAGCRPRTSAAMTALTPANQLTLLRMLLIPAFVILVVYGHLGWALIVFVTAGITDGLDGLIARRSGQKTSLGAWLDPMADKLLLVTTFIVLTLPGPGPREPAADLADRADHQPRRRHRADRGDRQPRDRPADVPAVDLRQDRDRHLHRHRGRRDAVQLPRLPFARSSTSFVYASLAITLVSASTTSGTRRASSTTPATVTMIETLIERWLVLVVSVWSRLCCRWCRSGRRRRSAQTPPKQAVVETSRRHVRHRSHAGRRRRTRPPTS